jgi:uncharacterized protein YoxC
MTTLDTIIAIAEIILFISLSALAIFLIAALKKVTDSVQNIERNVTDLEKKVEPLIENTNKVLINAGEITGDVKMQLARIESLIDTVKNKSEQVVGFTNKLQYQIEKPVNESLNFISALRHGVKTFFLHLSNNERKYSYSGNNEK